MEIELWLAFVAAAAVLLVVAAAPATHRVAADARLEGRIQRAVVAGVPPGRGLPST